MTTLAKKQAAARWRQRYYDTHGEWPSTAWARKRKAQGLCPQCGKPVGPTYTSTCDACAPIAQALTKRRNARLRARGSCVGCAKRKAAAGATRCPACRDALVRYSGAWKRAQEKRRQAAGLCIKCGKAAPQPGAVRCEPCIATRREDGRRSYERKLIKNRTLVSSTHPFSVPDPVVIVHRTPWYNITNEAGDILNRDAYPSRISALRWCGHNKCQPVNSWAAYNAGRGKLVTR